MVKFRALYVVTVLQMYTYIQAFQDVSMKYVQLLYINHPSIFLNNWFVFIIGREKMAIKYVS